MSTIAKPGESSNRMPPELHYDLDRIDFTKIEADREAIRAYNPQRFIMEHIDAVLFSDPVNQIIVGYKDVRSDEFWVPGHMPNYPILPGVLICEASAQLCSYYVMKGHLIPGDFIGFGGMENVRFRAPVYPGHRLVLVGKNLKISNRMTLFNVQGFVDQKMVFHGDILGMPLRNRPEAAP